MKNQILLLLACAFLMFPLGSCNSDSDSDEQPTPNNGVQNRVDMTVVVPVHPSSLEYFDYVIHYYDNRGKECRDTLRGNYGVRYYDNGGEDYCDTIREKYGIFSHDNNGLVQVDTIRKENGTFGREDAGNLTTASNGISCFVKTFSYDDLFVTCTVKVQMLPKNAVSFLEPFFFCSPKPHIFANVNSSDVKTISEAVSNVANSVETVLISGMTFESFEKKYGYTYLSHCSVTDTYTGCEIFFY